MVPTTSIFDATSGVRPPASIPAPLRAAFDDTELSEGDEAYLQMLYIHPEECIDCGACEPECPVEAIFPEDEVPEKWSKYTAYNYEAFGMSPP